MLKTLGMLAAIGGLSAAFAAPAMAEVVEAKDGHFITRAEAVVEADRKATWLALISPARWWSNEHTWSADAANLSLTPQAGGCFCEKIPEVDEPDRFTLEGSVEHMRVIQAYPEVALRMAGGLGPLQSEPVTGILTIAISEVEGGQGTRIVWEYNVGGAMRYPVPVISQAVDGVMTLQLGRLADLLGVIEGPSSGPAAPAAPDGSEPEGESDGDSPVSIDPEEMLEDGAPPPRSPADGPSVDEAFTDLGDPGG